MKDKLKKILDDAMTQIDSSERLDRLNEIKVSFLGKKYTNRVNVSKGAYNLLSIVVQDESIK